MRASAANAPPDGPAPMCVFIYSKQCNVCPKVKPIIGQLEQEYGTKIRFIALDVTDNSNKVEARKKAKELGVSAFVAFCEDNYPTVGIFNTQRKCIKEVYGFHPKESYDPLLKKALE